MLGTRVLLLLDLLRWATDKQSPHVFWLCGMAGTGKTTTTESFCMLLHQKKMLGASFFCSNKASDRSDIRKVFPSLAKSLASMSSGFGKELVKRLGDLDDPLGMNIADQYQKLILEAAELTLGRDNIIVLVVDALDECVDKQTVKSFLDVILASKPGVMLRFFVTSRPDSFVRDVFAERKRHSVLYLHDIQSCIVQEDIALYLDEQLAGIPGLKAHYDSWPPSEIDTLVSHAGNLFIYASTIYQYIADADWDPYNNLQNICKLGESGKKAANIDALYSFILTEVFKKHEEKIPIVTKCISLLLAVQSPLPISTYSKLLDKPLQVIEKAFGLLHAVIKVPKVNSSDEEVTIYHASFSDYLFARSKGYKWAVNIVDANCNAAYYCLRLLNTELHLGVSGA